MATQRRPATVYRSEREGIWIALSDSQPGTTYEVEVDGGGIRCGCKGYEFNSSCRHTKAVAAEIAIDWERRAAAGGTMIEDSLLQLAGELQDHVWTSRYQSRKLLSNPALAKVRITLGSPRFLRPDWYTLDATLMKLAPTRQTFHAEGAEWRRLYVAQLEELTPGGVLLMLVQTREDVGGRDLVLLCYENVLESTDECHRRLLADWLAERTGLIVPELTEARAPEEAKLL